jgi:hypothetical protein
MSSPELYPVGIDRRRHTISFVPMSKDRYRNAFLDPRTTRMGPSVYTFNLDDLLLFGLHARNRAAPVHYVFHTAFCCSTLLARYLDLIPPCFVLREPSVLAQVAMLRPHDARGLDGKVGSMATDEWQALMDLTVRLLTRTYKPQDVVAIKVNDLCNSVGDVLLTMDTRSRVIFLYVSLRSFVLSVLKRQSRRVWLRTRIRDTERVAKFFPALANVDATRLRDAEAAAYLWLLNSALYHDLRTGEHSERVMALDGQRLAENPDTAVSEVAAFFRLTLPQRELDELLNHPSVGRYSKDLSLEYDSESRQRDLAQAQARFGTEADKGMEWARGIRENLEFEARP